MASMACNQYQRVIRSSMPEEADLLKERKVKKMLKPFTVPVHFL